VKNVQGNNNAKDYLSLINDLQSKLAIEAGKP